MSVLVLPEAAGTATCGDTWGCACPAALGTHGEADAGRAWGVCSCRRSVLGFMLCTHCPEILNDLWAQSPGAPHGAGPAWCFSVEEMNSFQASRSVWWTWVKAKADGKWLDARIPRGLPRVSEGKGRRERWHSEDGVIRKSILCHQHSTVVLTSKKAKMAADYKIPWILRHAPIWQKVL